MNPGDTIRLSEDIIRKFEKKDYVYGKVNDKVSIISVRGDVLIVQGKEKFSVHISKVTPNI